jgi:hypothetical protein
MRQIGLDISHGDDAISKLSAVRQIRVVYARKSDRDSRIVIACAHS